MADVAEVTYGNREGQYFTEWRFDLLKELLGYVMNGPIPGTSEPIQIDDANIWYDAQEDFHRLIFKACGHQVEVQLYKVFSSKVDGEEHWVGCPRNQIWEYALSLRRKLGVVPAQ